VIALLAAILICAACSNKPDPSTLVMIIESSPTNLDPRVGLDAQSERIDDLLFDDLFTRDEHLNVQPGLVERWETPDPRTYVFHLHSGVKFHDGRPLTSRDVKWTFDSLLQGKILSTKTAAYRFVDSIEAPDASTVIFHLKEPDAPLLWSLSDGAIGIVPYGSGNEMSRHPVGSGPFRFVSAEQDKNVIIESNDNYWGQKPRLKRVHFDVVPDMTTRALELRKGSADIALNALTEDMVLTLQQGSSLQVAHALGTRLAYMGFNLRDPILKDVRVRQALAKAIDRRPIIHYLLRDFARPASNLLPPERLRSSRRPSAARCSGVSPDQWNSFSSHHEDFHRGEHSTVGCSPATTIAGSGHRAGHSNIRVSNVFF
jgi:peptide/nickel transport system substrate-binding protein